MIPSSGYLLWLPDLPGPAGASAMPTVSYTTPWDTIVIGCRLKHLFFYDPG